MKKIVISLAIIGVVAGITLGITGAFWTDEGVSSNQSFVSGNLDLKLSNDNSNYYHNVSQTWNVGSMTPGGTPYVSTLYMKNVGSVNADYLKFTVVNNPSIPNMDKRMRITQLDYKGESLLTGGAGADLSSYVAPTNCTVTTSYINQAINSAQPGDVICVKPGNYTFAWEGGVVDVDEEVTIASTDGPGSTTIGAGIVINADNVTVKGFKILVNNPCAGGGKEAVCLYDHDGVTIEYNEIDGTGVSVGQVIGIETLTGADYNNVLIQHNVIHDLKNTGIYTGPHTGYIEIKHNTFSNNFAGIGGFTRAIATLNEFFDNDEAIGIDSSFAGSNSRINENNFLNDDVIKVYHIYPGPVTATIDLTNNWWGDFNPSDQVVQVGGNYATADTSNFAGGPFIGFINGQDPYANGFADLDDFEHSTIVVGNPDLLPGGATYHTLKMGVQLDGPTTSNTFMGGKVGMNMTVTMGQGPAE